MALVLATSEGGGQLTASDIDPVAVASASRALEGTGARVLASDLFSAFAPDETFDLIVANMPYVPVGQLAFLPQDAREHESALSLDGGADGLDPLRRVAEELPRRLTRAGVFLTEAHVGQAASAIGVLRGVGLAADAHRVRGQTCVVEARPGSNHRIPSRRARRRDVEAPGASAWMP